jgi:hypothetical protein
MAGLTSLQSLTSQQVLFLPDLLLQSSPQQPPHPSLLTSSLQQTTEEVLFFTMNYGEMEEVLQPQSSKSPHTMDRT